MDEDEAARALEGMQATRRRLGMRARWSLPRHMAVGLVMGLLVASYALPPRLTFVAAAACLLATGLIVYRDRRRDGFFVSGYRAGKTRPLTFLLLGAVLTALALAMVLRERFGLAWAPLALGAIVAVLATGASIAWERVYRRELGADGDGA